MSKKAKDTLRLTIILIVIVAVLITAFLVIREGSKIPENDRNTVGNTPSNLYNGGLFCEGDDGKVYFSNSYDEGSLYVMDPDESNMKKLNKYFTKWINEAGDYIYFYENSDGAAAIAGFGGHMMGVYRSKKNGEDIKCLDKTPCGIIALAGSKLYYQHYSNQNAEGMTLYTIGIDKKEGGKMVVDDVVSPACVFAGSVYYSGVNGDHNLYRINIDTDSTSQVYSGDVYNPVMVSSDTFYYMNVADDYRIYRATMSGENTKITEERVDCFNVAGDYIYYQANKENALMRCRRDGGESEMVMQGAFKDINSTSRYVYFSAFDSQGITYRCPVNGPVSVSEFSAARQAAGK